MEVGDSETLGYIINDCDFFSATLLEWTFHFVCKVVTQLTCSQLTC